MWRMLGATLLWHTHTHSEKKNIAECHERKSLDVSVNSIFTPFRLPYTGYFIPCFLFLLWPSLYLQSFTAPILHLAKSHPPTPYTHTGHIHGNWETHDRCHKVNVHRQRKYTAIQQDMHLLHTGAEGKQTQRPWETAMCDWCENKQIRPLMSGQYSWAKPSSRFWGKTARSVYVDAQVCVCVCFSVWVSERFCVSVNWGVFIPEVVVFHLFLHQFCPVGGKRRVCVRVCVRVYVCVCVRRSK